MSRGAAGTSRQPSSRRKQVAHIDTAPSTPDPPSAPAYATAIVELAVALRAGGEHEHVERLTAARRDATAAFLDALRAGPGDDAFAVVVARAGLDDDEAQLLALAVAIEHDEHLQRLIVSMTGDRDRCSLEIGLATELLGRGALVAAGPGSQLQRSAFVELVPRSPFGRTVVVVARRLLWALAGDGSADPDLAVDAQWFDVDEVATPSADVLVSGDDRIRRRELAAAALGRRRCLVVGPATDDEAWAAIVREATLNAAGVIVELDAPPAAIGRRWIERAGHLPWALSSAQPLPMAELPRLGWRAIDAPATMPSAVEWAAVVGPAIPRAHNLSRQQLDHLSLTLPAVGGDVDAAVRRMVSPKMNVLATHVRPRHRWADLVLSPGRSEQLRGLVDRYRNGAVVYDDWGFSPVPSRGVVALFSGPSGTGKTLAAEVVANELGVDLYKLDLSAVVSKWLGETEKNLSELFDAAAAGSFVLFFDEADALFAKRGAVSDSHDRYANVETSYLLQRLERYDGVVVLATNLEQNIDEAFMRRIHVRVDFGFPDRAARLRIWELHCASAAPQSADVDLEWLAQRFEVPGAVIRNAIVDAAFLAVAEDCEIGMSHLVRGIARELRKLGRLVTPEQFGDHFALVGGLDR